MTLRWSASALGDFDSLMAESRALGPDVADKAARDVRNAVNLIADMPQAGRVGRTPPTREWVLRRLPFIIVYVVDGSEIRVLALRHAARDWPAGFPET